MKQRLLGAIVLVAVGVIFIPMILTGGKDEMPYFGSNIPKQPEEIRQLQSLKFSKQPEPAQAPPLIRIPVDRHTPLDVKPRVKTQAKTTTEAKTPSAQVTQRVQKPADAKRPPKAWVVQVGSFNQRDNAMALRDKLRAKKYPSFVERLKGEKGEVYRVRVGPEATRTDAEKTMLKLRKQLKIYGVVMGHATETD